MKNLTIEIKANTKKAVDDINKLKTNIKQFGTNIKKSNGDLAKQNTALTSLSSSLKSLALAYGGFELFKGMATTIADFEQSIAKLGAISGASVDELQALEDKSRDLGETTQFSATQVAEAMNYQAMAGMKTNEILASTESILNLASVGQMDLARASDIATDSMSGFGLKSEDMGRITDVMATTITNANTNVEQLGEAFKNVAPVSKNLNVSLEETSAMLGILANSGKKGGEAGTNLKIIFQRLASTSKPVVEALNSIGVKAYDSTGKLKPLTQTIKDINSELVNLSEQERNDVMKKLYGEEAIAGASILHANLKETDELIKKVTDSNGKASDMAKTMNDTLSGSYKEMKSAIEGLALAIGDDLLPAMNDTVESITEVVKGTTEFYKENKALIKTIVELGATFYGLKKVTTVFSAILGAKAIADTVAFGSSLLKVRKKVGLLKTALFALSATNPVILGLGLAIAGVLYKLNEYQATIDTLNDSTNRFNATTKTTTDLYTQLDDAHSKANDTYSLTAKQYDNVGESIGKQLLKIEEEIETTKKASDGSKKYQEQLFQLEQQKKTLIATYVAVSDKLNIIKDSTDNATNSTKQLTLAEKERVKALEETKKKELEDLNKTYTKRVQQHTQTIFSLKNNETKLSNDIIKLNQDLQKKLANIETQRVHNAESIETQISNIRSSDAGKYEQYTNQKRTAEENLSKAKKALAEGDSQEYKHYADIYKGLVSSIAGTEITEKKKVKKYNRETHKWEKKTIDVIKLKKSDSNAYAINSLENLKGLENNYYAQKKQEEVTLHNQKVQQLQVQLQATKAQLEMEVQRLAIEKQILEATTGQTFNIDISGALASIKNIDNQIDLLDTQIKTVKPLKVDTSDAVQKVEEVRKYYGNLTLNDITFTVTADRTPADYGISKFITEYDGKYVAIRINPEYKEAQQRISDAIKNFENKPVVTKVDVDTKKATSGTKKFQQQATKPLTSKISADISKATNSIKKVQSLAKKIIVLTVKANISKAEIAIRKLQKSTSSTHTVYVKKVETHKAGGMVGDVLKLATGGKADFERKQGRISGYDPTDSDDVYAKLTRGEFVIKRDTVKHYGDDFLNRLNAQQLPKFATGGLVQAGTPEKLITQYSNNNNNNNNSDDKFDLSSLYELLRNIALFKTKPISKSFKKQLSSISKRATAQEVNGNSINDKKEELSKKNQQISDVKKESFLSGKSLKDNTKLSSLTNQTDTINDDIKLKIKIFEEKVRKITLALELLQAKYEQYQAKLSDVKEKIKKLFEKNKLELPTRIQEGTDLKKLELFNDKIHNLKPYKTHARNGSTSIHDSRFGTKYKTETVASQIEDKLKWFPKFQTGGHINGLEGGRLDGYGGGDKNLALLEDGEFIIRKEAVKRFGTDAMHKLNSMTVNLPKFQTGGSVGGANISSLASANNNSRNQTDINFQMPNGNSYALSSDTDIADNLAEEFRRLM